jgi:hypothetical protein
VFEAGKRGEEREGRREYLLSVVKEATARRVGAREREGTRRLLEQARMRSVSISSTGGLFQAERRGQQSSEAERARAPAAEDEIADTAHACFAPHPTRPFLSRAHSRRAVASFHKRMQVLPPPLALPSSSPPLSLSLPPMIAALVSPLERAPRWMKY